MYVYLLAIYTNFSPMLAHLCLCAMASRFKKLALFIYSETASADNLYDSLFMCEHSCKCTIDTQRDGIVVQ